VSAEHAQRYPLTWPVGWKRTDRSRRRRAPFKSYGQQLSVARGVDRLASELRLLAATDEILSSNVKLGLRGLPMSDGPQPEDVGAAVYFKLKGARRCLACDKWDRVADNIAAIAQHIDALRRIDRYGVGTLDQAFAGYAALPASTGDWWLVLELLPTATLVEVEEAFRRLAKEANPDVGGTHEAMARLTAAREIARRLLGGSPS